MSTPAIDLRDAAIAAMPGWVDRCVRSVMSQQDLVVTAEIEQSIIDAVDAAQAWLAELLDPVLATSDPEHVGTPLTVVRSAARFPTDVLHRAGASAVERDEFAVRHFPDDVFDLTPGAWADIDPSLLEPSIRWGAARVKAHLDSRQGQ